MAILSRRLIILAIMLYEKLIHHMKINLSPNTVLEYTAMCLSVIFELLPGLICLQCCSMLGELFDKNVYMNMNYSYPTTVYESIFAQTYVYFW